MAKRKRTVEVFDWQARQELDDAAKMHWVFGMPERTYAKR